MGRNENQRFHGHRDERGKHEGMNISITIAFYPQQHTRVLSGPQTILQPSVHHRDSRCTIAPNAFLMPKVAFHNEFPMLRLSLNAFEYVNR